MKQFLDLNYHFFTQKSINAVIKTYRANFGHLFYLKTKVNTITVFQTDSNDLLIKDGVQFISIKGKTLKRISLPIKFHKSLTSLAPDFILVHGMRYGLFSFLLKRKFKNSIVLVQVHGYADAPRGIERLIYKWSSKHIDGYLYTGKKNAQNFIDAGLFSEEKVFEVMEGSIDLPAKPSIEKKKNSFLWVGRLISKKDPNTVLNAFDDYLKINHTAKLKMVFGVDDLLVSVKTTINNSPRLKSNVELIGKLKKQELIELYKENQFFINGSHYEGSGYALLESMAYGCIPIITKIPPHEFMTGYGNCGFLYSVKSKKELLEKLMKLQEINILEEQSKVYKQFEDKLSFKAIAEDIYTVFDKLSKNKVDK